MLICGGCATTKPTDVSRTLPAPSFVVLDQVAVPKRAALKGKDARATQATLGLALQEANARLAESRAIYTAIKALYEAGK